MVELASGLFCDEGAALGRHVMRVVVVPVSRNRDPRGGTVVSHVASVRHDTPVPLSGRLREGSTGRCASGAPRGIRRGPRRRRWHRIAGEAIATDLSQVLRGAGWKRE